MNNLEKLTAGEIAAENNGTLEQLREVIGHCFPMSTSTRPTGGGFIYSKFGDLDWMFYSHTPTLPTIDITQLWEELQALKKPEKVEKSLEEKPLHEKLNELSELVDLRNKAIARHKVIFTEIEQIETKISALLK